MKTIWHFAPFFNQPEDDEGGPCGPAGWDEQIPRRRQSVPGMQNNLIYQKKISLRFFLVFFLFWYIEVYSSSPKDIYSKDLSSFSFFFLFLVMRVFNIIASQTMKSLPFSNVFKDNILPDLLYYKTKQINYLVFCFVYKY